MTHRSLWRRGHPLLFLLLAACDGATPEPSLAQRPASRVAPGTADSLTANVAATRRTAITTAVARVSPAVVTVQTERVERTATTPYDLLLRHPLGRTGRGGDRFRRHRAGEWRDRDQCPCRLGCQPD